VNTGDVLTLIGDLAALAAALFAFLALRKASHSIKEAKAQTLAMQAAAAEATAADRLAAADRQAATEAATAERRAAEQERLAQRVERVAELPETLFWECDSEIFHPGKWMETRNRLAVAAAGIKDRIPTSAVLENDATAVTAMGHARQIVNEAGIELRRLHGELARPTEGS
jgi:hypothetical protein